MTTTEPVINIATPPSPGGPAAPIAPNIGVPAPAGAPTAASPQAVFFPDNWKEGLGDEFKQDPTISKYQTVPELAKAHINLQKMMGKDKISLPDKYATAEDWRSVYQKLGLPEKPDLYEVNVPADTFKPEFIKQFKAQAFENNVLPQQAEKLLGWYANIQKEEQAKETRAMADAISMAQQALKREWGEAFDTKKVKAETAARRFFNADGVDFLNNSGLVNNVHFAKAMAAVGELLQEHGIKGNPASYTGLTPGDADTRIAEIMGNKAHPYWVGSHPGHKAAVDEVAMLYRAKHPEV